MTARNTLLGSALVCLLGSAIPAIAADDKSDKKDPLVEGREITFDRKKGNCLACHMIEKGEAPGTIGPPLMEMKQRFPEREKLRAQIYDATQRNANTAMPPFGRHEILSEQELEKVVDYIWSL